MLTEPGVCKYVVRLTLTLTQTQTQTQTLPLPLTPNQVRPPDHQAAQGLPGRGRPQHGGAQEDRGGRGGGSGAQGRPAHR